MKREPPNSGIAQRRAARIEGTGANYHDRREEILTAAVRLFREKGYRRTSLVDIAEAVGADRASLYYYFGSKEELLNEAVTPVVLQNTAIAEALRESDEPAPVKLYQLITGLLTSYAEQYPLLYLYLEENLSHVEQSRQAWARNMRSVNRRYISAVEGIIARGIADGTLLPLADPQILANGLMGMVSWTHRWFNPQRSPASARTIGDAYAHILIRGIATDDAYASLQSQLHPDQPPS